MNRKDFIIQMNHSNYRVKNLHISSTVTGVGTNNIGELNGILSAIMKLNECNFNNNVEIFTDSDYSIRSIWKTMNGIQCKKNQNLLREIESAIDLCDCRIGIKWVRGHKDD